MVRIRWHGHACFEVDGSVRIVTDPHDGKSLGIAPPKAKADLVLVSHDHFDHNCASLVKGKDGSVVDKPIMTVEKGVRIEGTMASHDTENGSKRGKVTIFRFEMDGTTFCHLGDLGHVLSEADVDRISPVDVMFIPVGDVFTIGPEAAAKIVNAVRPRVAVPMHYRVPGLGLAIQPVQNFLKLYRPEQIIKVGNEVEFTEEDLPKSGTEIWVFSS
ncbi:MAG: MBL fold metallo-hydrolase [Thermoplasmata archaeon]|jgi:L-ascorbate metabolism protein UlaG (beta-lactamase superfamily)|nr:MBL fold metallo-hydrolase [Thermoplasmata archaeon]